MSRHFGLGWTKIAKEAKIATLSGDIRTAIAISDRALVGGATNKQEQIKKTKRYLLGNADSLGPAHSLGIIESNVDKLVANRMKKRGMAWTTAGARRMLKLLEKKFKEDFAQLVVVPKDLALPQSAKQVIETLADDPQTGLVLTLQLSTARMPVGRGLRFCVRL